MSRTKSGGDGLRGSLDWSEGERRAAERPKTSPSRRESDRATRPARSLTEQSPKRDRYIRAGLDVEWEADEATATMPPAAGAN